MFVIICFSSPLSPPPQTVPFRYTNPMHLEADEEGILRSPRQSCRSRRTQRERGKRSDRVGRVLEDNPRVEVPRNDSFSTNSPNQLML